MAEKVVVEGTGTWVGLRRGERRSYLLTDVVQRRIDRGFYSVVERSEIADHTPPTDPEPVAKGKSLVDAYLEKHGEFPADEPEDATELEPPARPRRRPKAQTEDA